MLAELLQRRVGAVNRPHQVGLDNLLVLFQRRLIETRNRAHAGVVNPNIDPAELINRTLCQLFHFTGAADVGLHHQRLGAGFTTFSCKVFQQALAARGQHHPGTVLRELQGGSAAKAAGRSSYNHNPIAHLSHNDCLRLERWAHS